MTKSETYISFIIDELRSGNVTYSNVLALFVEKWHISKRTFDRHWKKAQEQYKNERTAIETIKTDLHTTSEIEAAKSQIKTKTQRLEILQKQINNSETELENNLEFDHIVVNGKVQKVSRPMTVTERARLRTVIRDLQAEISKIEGDYAASKIEQSGTLTVRTWKVQPKT